jgi:hypothetical protein
MYLTAAALCAVAILGLLLFMPRNPVRLSDQES